MKKIAVIFLILTTTVSYSQSTIYDDNEKADFINGQTGRFVYSLTDVGVEDIGGGQYKISLYSKGSSTPEVSITVKYQKYNEDGLYEYHSTRSNSKTPLVMTQYKLSSVASGKAGVLGIAYSQNEGIIFKLGQNPF